MSTPKTIPVTCVACGYKFARGSRNVLPGASKDKGRCKNRKACVKRQEAHTYR